MHPLPNGDQRRQLRVIDIKLTARASQSYFAEVAYYSMALAGWLIDQRLDNTFVVVADGAVWPGAHEASNLVRVHREFMDQGATPILTQPGMRWRRTWNPCPLMCLHCAYGVSCKSTSRTC